MSVFLDELVSALPWLVAAWLLGIGLYAIVTSRNFVHLIGCLSVVQSSTYVLLLAVGYRRGGIAPIFYTHPPGTPAVDPVMQALVLQLHKRRGTLDPEQLRPMHR